MSSVFCKFFEKKIFYFFLDTKINVLVLWSNQPEASSLMESKNDLQDQQPCA